MPKNRVYRRSVDAKQNKEIKKLKAQVKTLVNTNEIKHLNMDIPDPDINAYTLGSYKLGLTDLDPWASDALNANQIRPYQREGDAVLVKRVKIKAMITLPETGPDPTYNSVVRVLVVHWPTAGNESLTEILQDTGTVFSQYQNYPETPYKVLYDKSFNLQSIIPSNIGGSSRNATSVEPFRRNVNISIGAKQLGKSGVKVHWAGTGAQEPTQGAIALYAFSDQSGVTNTSPFLSGTARLTYMDN